MEGPEMVLLKHELTPLRTMLGEANKCKACQMELLPFMEEEGIIQMPDLLFCDKICETVYKQSFRQILHHRREVIGLILTDEKHL